MMNIRLAMARNALVLAAFAALTTAAVATLVWFTSDRVADNQRLAREAALAAVMPRERHDNDLLGDSLQVQDTLLGDDKPHTVWRAWKDGRAAGVVVEAVAPEGYGGSIRLLVGIAADGTLTGVRALTPHAETPGLGDAIEARKSDWILGFTGKSLGNPPESRWAVRKDGGDFDQFTGATITPRAVVSAVRDTLRWHARHGAGLFAEAPGAQP
jgi:electron transport complex protein RnfG